MANELDKLYKMIDGIEIAMMTTRRPDGHLESRAMATQKAADKNVDLLVANDVTEPGAGFGVDTNHVAIVFPDGRVEDWEKSPTTDIARRLWDLISNQMALPR